MTEKTKKIVMLPLDERPCNYDYPKLMPSADFELVLPPREIMGDKKSPADTSAIAAWLLAAAKDADACVLSLDTLIYGGIVPSRLHNEDTETLIARAAIVERLKAQNPKMKLYVFQLIMRCPGYSLSDEEPDYYDDYGEEIHLFGRYQHLKMLGKMTSDDERDLDRIEKKLDKSCLDDFVSRRKKNLDVLMHNLDYAKSGMTDYFIIPQDDAAVYGFTSMDQLRVREYLKENSLHLKTAMYPSADDTGLTLLCRAVNELHGEKPRIFVRYASCKGGLVIPWFEDRILDETVKYQIMAAGGVRVLSLTEADMLLAINVGSGMYNREDPEYVTAYDIERNLGEFVSYIEYAEECGKVVAVGDVATANGGDEELVRLLRDRGLMFKIHAYAAWNTSSNTLGTAICQGLLYRISRDRAANVRFLLHRYFEDISYMGYARKRVTDEYLPKLGLDYFHADGERGKVAELVGKEMTAYMKEHYPEAADMVKSIDVRMPWRRMFEVGIDITAKDVK